MPGWMRPATHPFLFELQAATIPIEARRYGIASITSPKRDSAVSMNDRKHGEVASVALVIGVSAAAFALRRPPRVRSIGLAFGPGVSAARSGRRATALLRERVRAGDDFEYLLGDLCLPGAVHRERQV